MPYTITNKFNDFPIKNYYQGCIREDPSTWNTKFNLHVHHMDNDMSDSSPISIHPITHPDMHLDLSFKSDGEGSLLLEIEDESLEKKDAIDFVRAYNGDTAIEGDGWSHSPETEMTDLGWSNEAYEEKVEEQILLQNPVIDAIRKRNNGYTTDQLFAFWNLINMNNGYVRIMNFVKKNYAIVMEGGEGCEYFVGKDVRKIGETDRLEFKIETAV